MLVPAWGGRQSSSTVPRMASARLALRPMIGGEEISRQRVRDAVSLLLQHTVPVQLSISLLISIDLRGRCEKKKKKKRKILAAPVMQTECGRAESLA